MERAGWPRLMAATVLIADDNEKIRHAFKRLLGAIPDVSVVAEAGDGKEAVQLALEHRPAFVLMDISMPHLDGFEATRRIRLNAPEVQVIVVTADLSDLVVRKSFEVGADGFVAKVAAADELPGALAALSHGEQFVSPRIRPGVTRLSDHPESEAGR